MKKNKELVERERIAKGTLKRVLGLFKGHRFLLFCTLLAAIVSGAVAIISNSAIEQVVKYADPNNAEHSITNFWIIIGVLGVLFCIGTFADWFSARFSMSNAEKIMHGLRSKLFGKMQKLPLSYFDKKNVGDSMSLFTNDTDMLREFLMNAVTNTVTGVLMLLGIMAMLLYYNVVLALITFALYLILFGAAGVFAGKSTKLLIKRQSKLATLNGFAEEMLTGQRVVKAFSREKQTVEKFGELNEDMRNVSRPANFYMNLIMPLMQTVGNLVTVTVMIIATVFVLKGIFVGGGVLPKFELAQALAFVTLTGFLGRPVGMIAENMQHVAKGLAGANRIFRVMDEKAEIDDGDVELVRAHKGDTFGSVGEWYWKRVRNGELVSGQNEFEYVKVMGDVRFNDVVFSYDGKKKVLDRVMIWAKPGQKIALVGHTGAGKTTIASLINRFYDVQEGEITFDGIPIKSIKKESLRRSLSVVLQDTNLFSGTVMDNIRYGRLDATDEECIAACKLASAHSFIMRLPEGYETRIENNGDGLSQGQRQLLSIARAAVADCPVLILDEATSSVDTRTELHIEHGMDRLMHGRTTFVIAHRLSTIRNAKAIMVMEDGKIIERGNHDFLIGEKGKYYQLYTGAFELA